MNKKIKAVFFALGLLSSGIAIGQAFSLVSIVNITSAKPSELPTQAEDLMNAYQDKVGTAQSAVQIQQVASETSVRLQYIQIRQNAEVIRLLNQIAAKK